MSRQQSEPESQYNDVINKLQYYMLNENTIKQSLQCRINITEPVNKISRQTPLIIKQKCDTFTPIQKDTLFWCFYILKFGENNYEMLGNINIVLEKKLKIEYVEKIRKEKHIVKSYKFATLTHIENKLANEEKIDLNTFLTLCVIENINVLYVYKKIYFEFI